MAKNIGPKIGIEGESQYKKEMSQIIQQAKTLDAQMKALSASFDDESDAVEKNEQTTKLLGKQIENQKEAVAKLTEMHQKYVDAYGESDVKTLKFGESLAKAQTKLYGLEGELKKSNQELEGFSDSSEEAESGVEELGDEEEKTTHKTNIFGEALKAALSKEVIMGTLNAIKDGMVAIGKAAYSFGKEVVMAYADYEQLEGGVKKLFGDNDWELVVKNAQNAFKTAGLSANEYMETVTSFSASLVSSLGGDTKEAAELADRAIRDMSDNANTFGTDMQSIQNAYQGQYNMLDNLKLGYGGTKSEMERLVKDAEKLNSSFKAQRDSTGALTLAYSDVIKAIGIVQDDMKITGTTAREASGTISGSLDTLKSSVKNLIIGLGTNNADIDNLLGNVVESFQNVVNNIQPIIERLIDYGPGIIGAVIPVLQSMAPDLINTAVGLFNGLLEAVISVLPDLVPVAIDAINLLAGTLIDNLPIIIDAGIQLIIGLIEGFADALPVLIDQAPKIISTLANAIINNLPRILEAGAKILQALANGMISMIGSLPQIVLDILTNIWENVKAAMQGVRDLMHFSEPDKGPLKDFNTYAPDMMKTFAQGIKKNQHLVTDAASEAMQGVSTAMTAGSTTNNAYNYGGFNFTVYQQPGESSEALVDRIMYAMQNRINDRKAVYA